MPKANPDTDNDISMTVDGEPIIGDDGDFQLSEGIDCIIESCIFRLKTVIGDWILEPTCGASLEELIGEPNSRETAATMEGMAIRALTHDGFLSTDSIETVAMPVDSTTILLSVIISYSDKLVNLAVSLDLKEGKITITQ